MNTKKISLALIVLAMAFSIGFVTYKAAELVKNLLIGSKTDCSQQYEPSRCASTNEPLYPPQRSR